MGEVEIVELIRTRLLRRGDGIPESPLRIVEQYWTKEGELLFEFDPCPDGKARMDPGGAPRASGFRNN